MNGGCIKDSHLHLRNRTEGTLILVKSHRRLKWFSGWISVGNFIRLDESDKSHINVWIPLFYFPPQ